MAQNYETIPQEEKHEKHEGNEGHEGHEAHNHGEVHNHRAHDAEGFPKETSVWSGLPTWVLLIVEYLIGLAIVETLAGAVSLFWVVAAVYHYNITGHRWIQFILAIVGFVVALVVSPFTLPILVIIGIIHWVVYIFHDLHAVVNHNPRPKITPPYFTGLFTYAN